MTNAPNTPAPRRGNLVSVWLPDADLWTLIVGQPTPEFPGYNRYGPPISPRWLAWAKGVVMNTSFVPAHFNRDKKTGLARDKALALYLCRLIRVVDSLGDNQEFGRRDAAELENLLLGAADVASLDIELRRINESGPKRDHVLRDAIDAGWIQREEVDLWRPGMKSGSGMSAIYWLTFLGKRKADEIDGPPPFYSTGQEEDLDEADDLDNEEEVLSSPAPAPPPAPPPSSSPPAPPPWRRQPPSPQVSTPPADTTASTTDAAAVADDTDGVAKRLVWDLYPLAKNSWGAWEVAPEIARPDHRVYMYRYQADDHQGPVMELAMLRKLKTHFPGMAITNREAYVPTEDDFALLKLCYPKDDPHRPNWYIIKAHLHANNHNPDMLDKTEAPGLLALLKKIMPSAPNMAQKESDTLLPAVAPEAPQAPAGQVSLAADPAGQEDADDNKGKRMGNPSHRPATRDRAADAKLVADWEASGLTKSEFERARGLPEDEIRKAQDSVRKPRKGSANAE